MKNNNYFFCYNKKVSDFMKTKNIHHITVAIDPKTKRIFSLFEINDTFQQALNEYKAQPK